MIIIIFKYKDSTPSTPFIVKKAVLGSAKSVFNIVNGVSNDKSFRIQKSISTLSFIMLSISSYGAYNSSYLSYFGK